MAKGKYEKWLEPDSLILLEGWARDGLTDEQIALKVRINVATLYRWKEKYCEICEALKKGKDVVDIKVENALLKRALGYSYKEVKCKRENGVLTEETTTTKEVIPDVTAQIIWLKNRRPNKWRDKQKDETDEDKLKKLDEILAEIKADAERSTDNAVHD